jgi:hypothetical protein
MFDRAAERHLRVLCERNAELERRREKLTELVQSLSDNSQTIDGKYDAMLTSQENQCIDMVAFDEEIKSLTRTLFPPAGRQPPRPRDQAENQRLILEQMMALQRLDPAQREQRLHDSDPLIIRAKLDSATATRFIQKYKSFL